MSGKRRVSPAEFQVAVRQMSGRLEQRVRANLRRAATEAILPAIARSAAAVRPPPDATGTYMRSWSVEVLRDGVRVFNPTEAAVHVETGRRPGGFPSVAAIREWCRTKGLDEAAAYPIAAAIARRGIKGRGVLRSAAPVITREVKQAVARAVRSTEP